MQRTGFKQKTFAQKLASQKYRKGKKKKQEKRWGIKLWSIHKADLEFSHWIRTQKNYTCENCRYHVEPRTQEIQCSHYIGRAEYATRYDPENCDVLCAKCHKYFEDRKMYEYRDWKINKIGADAHEKLRVKKYSYKSTSQSIYDCMVLLGAIKI